VARLRALMRRSDNLLGQCLTLGKSASTPSAGR